MTRKPSAEGSPPTLRVIEGPGYRTAVRLTHWQGMIAVEMPSNTVAHPETVDSIIDLFADRLGVVQQTESSLRVIFGLKEKGFSRMENECREAGRRLLGHLALGDAALIEQKLIPPDPAPATLRSVPPGLA